MNTKSEGTKSTNWIIYSQVYWSCFTYPTSGGEHWEQTNQRITIFLPRDKRLHPNQLGSQTKHASIVCQFECNQKVIKAMSMRGGSVWCRGVCIHECSYLSFRERCFYTTQDRHINTFVIMRAIFIAGVKPNMNSKSLRSIESFQ